MGKIRSPSSLWYFTRGLGISVVVTVSILKTRLHCREEKTLYWITDISQRNLCGIKQ